MSHQGYSNVPPNGGKKNKKFAIIGVSSVILVAMVVAVAVGVSKNSGKGGSGGGEVSTSTKAVQAICQPTDYKEACAESLKSANSTDPRDLVKAAFQVTMDQITSAVKNSSTLKELAKDSRTNQALENCDELMDYAIDDLKASFRELGDFDVSKLDDYVENLKIWLSAAITYQETCLDGFKNTTGDAGETMKKLLNTAGQLTRNGLAMVSDIGSILSSLHIPGVSRRLLTAEEEEAASHNGESFPKWVNGNQRRLLAETPATIKPNVTVALDGSGQFKSVNAALSSIPKNGNTTFVIYVKAGVYSEQVMINKSMTHVMMIGDGATKTKITGSSNFIDGTPTFKTATFSAIGDNFMAKDMGFENSAGANKHQAVALRVQSDMSIFYQCQMDGYQDTLYAHAHRQFYRDCTISGTIDFIFGDAAAMFQNCRMVVRKAMANQQCIVTAQGRVDRREATGLVLQNCHIMGDPLLDKTTLVYLGRPWKNFSRTVVMQSEIDALIHSDGWLPWAGTMWLDTLYYGEYMNRGPGSAMDKRVNWTGIQKMTPQNIVEFTAGKFIGGDSWVPPSGVPYSSGLMAV